MNAHEGAAQARDVDLEKLIQEDITGDATRSLAGALHEAAAPLSGALFGTLTQETYLLTQQLLHSLQAAEQILVTAWEEIHHVR